MRVTRTAGDGRKEGAKLQAHKKGAGPRGDSLGYSGIFWDILGYVGTEGLRVLIHIHRDDSVNSRARRQPAMSDETADVVKM